MSITEIDTMPRRALAFTPMETDWRLIVDAAIHAEDAGYEAVLVPEGWALDATVVLGEIARHTRRIRLATGILSIWGRTAATLAMTAATRPPSSAVIRSTRPSTWPAMAASGNTPPLRAESVVRSVGRIIRISAVGPLPRASAP